MKLFARPKCFSEAIALMTILNCLLGLRVFEYPRGHPRSILSLIYFLFLCGIFCVGSLTMKEKYYAFVRPMKLEYVLYQLLTYFTVVSIILKMLLSWWYAKKFKVCHKKIFEVDETLRQLGFSANYDKIYFITIGMITIWITICFILSSVAFIHLKIHMDIFSSIYTIFIAIYSLTVNVITVFEFYIFVKLINRLFCENLIKKIKLDMFERKDNSKIMDAEQRKHILSTMIFRWCRRVQSRINVSVSEKQDPIVPQIESHFPSQFKKQFQSEPQSRFQRHNLSMIKCQDRKHLLQIIKQVHLELCKISKIICTIFGVQMAWEVGAIIIYLTAALYNLYVRYIMQQKDFIIQISLMLICNFLNILKAVSTSQVCKNTASEGNRTIEIIHAIHGCDADANMQEEIQQFGIQILQSPVTFSVFGLTLDNRILSMILRTVTIYIVITVQVSNILESNNAIQYVQF